MVFRITLIINLSMRSRRYRIARRGNILKKIIPILLVILILSALPISAESPAASSLSVGFSPGGTAVKLVLEVIGEAKSSFLVACNEFTDRDIAAALEAAAHRGVKVQMVADAKAARAKYSQVPIVSAAGIPVRLATRYAIMHNKLMVIGSFNYTTAATKSNAENALVLRNAAELAKVYAAEWARLWDEAGEK
jgi:phosphatidylserine/phosphatidylglycerophosphate/cardiolipin synthase-like enzyme